MGGILGYMAQDAIPRAGIPPATPHCLWLPPFKIAQMDIYTPVPVPTRLQQAASSSPNRLVPHGSSGSIGEKKLTFLKMTLDDVGYPNKWFQPILALRKCQDALKQGCFGSEMGQNVSKSVLKAIPDHLERTNK